jgi:hypothetical protein
MLGFGCLASCFLISDGRGVHDFAPSPLAPMRSHVSHSGAVTVILCGRFRQADSRRSSTRISPRPTASRSAFLTVVRQTPARAAICSRVRVQASFLITSDAITAKTACSATVNRAASFGGRRPEAAQERRRSMEALLRGREPTRRCTGF